MWAGAAIIELPKALLKSQMAARGFPSVAVWLQLERFGGSPDRTSCNKPGSSLGLFWVYFVFVGG